MFGLFMQQMRLRAVRRLPIAFGWLTRSGDAATATRVRAAGAPERRALDGAALAQGRVVPGEQPGTPRSPKVSQPT